MARLPLLTASLALALLGAGSATGAPIAYDGFDYSPGALEGNDGGTGDWKDKWSGDSDIEVVSGGWSYTDSLGQSLIVSGNRIGLDSGSDTKKAERQITDKVGTTSETVWLSFLFEGSSATTINNVSIGDGLFVGQGGKDGGSSTIWLSDQDGLVGDTGISADSQSFLVARVDFTSGSEDVWLWVDPDLAAEPDIALADANGIAKEFEADFLRAQLSDTSAGFDEIRFGYYWYEVLAEAPEPSTALMLGLGLAGLSLHARRQQRR